MSEVHPFQTPSRVITIPARINPSQPGSTQKRKRLVAGYGRVSTNSEEQKTSYEAQVSYYTDYIKSNEEWEFVGVYTDRGVTGTSTKKRDDFNRMIQDALDGKIDLIVTKSVSRFARNTVDSLVAIRRLKEKGVEVYFEEQNIYTLDSKGEVLITIMASLAQDESRNISENVTWGHRKRFKDGKVLMPYGRFLGYKKGEDDIPEIVEDEAEIVRRIYREFLEGKSPHAIAKGLKEDAVLTPSRKSTNWQAAVVRSILTNERYKGDALLQKSFTVDFLTKKTKKNEGEVPQYYAENSHPAIIKPEVFDYVQTLIEAGCARHSSAVSIFSGKILCGECGSIYGSKVWHSNSQYRRTIWQCNAKFKKTDRSQMADRCASPHQRCATPTLQEADAQKIDRCATPHLTETDIQKADRCATPHLTDMDIQVAFVEAVNRLLERKTELLATYGTMVNALTDTARQEKEAEALQKSYDDTIKRMEVSIHMNASTPLNQAEYQRQYDELLEAANAAKADLQRVNNEIVQRTRLKKTLLAFMRELERRRGVLAGFDGELWTATVESVTVSTEELQFTFKDGSVQSVKLSK